MAQYVPEARLTRRGGGRLYWAEVRRDDGAGCSQIVYCKGRYATREEAMQAAGEQAELLTARAQGYDVRNAAELIQLRLASPMRPLARSTHDVDGLGLFDHARQPCLI